MTQQIWKTYVPVYIFRGDTDTFQQKPQADIFKKLSSDESKWILYETDASGGHDFAQEQFINALNHIYGELDNKYNPLSLTFSGLNDPSDTWAEDGTGTLLKIDQSEFIDYGFFEGSSGMRTKGWLYLPNTCATTQCKLVVWLHGGNSIAVNML